MRTLGRRAAIGATTVALALAAAGSSVAAVRSSRYEGGVASGPAALAPGNVSGDADRAGAGAGPDTDRGAGPAPAADGVLVPGAGIPSLPGAAGPGAGPVVGPSSTAGAAAAPGQTGGVPAAAGGAPSTPSAGTATPSAPAEPRSTTATILGPAAGPTPTTALGRPASVACPSDAGQGALPAPRGDLRAVDFTLPWPGSPLVLLPQVSSVRPLGLPVRVTGSSLGGFTEDGEHLTVVAPEAPDPIRYSVQAAQASAAGSITFTSARTVVVNVQMQGCRDRSLTLYDMALATHEARPLRIVGTVGPSGEITVSDDGGTARFRAGPGIHRVVLVTANDAGMAGPLVVASVIVP